MNKLIKVSNFFILFLALFVFLFTKPYENITNSILEIIPQSKNKEILEAYEKNSNTKKIFLAIKGSDENSLEKIKKIEKKISKIEGVSLDNKIFNSYGLKYQNNYHLYLNSLDEKRLKNLNIDKELKKIKDDLLNSFFPILINKNDPLNLFKSSNKKTEFKIKNKYLVLENFGLFSSFKLNKEINSLEKYTKIYKQIELIKKEYPDIKIFSPIFYFVENSQAIKQDVDKIILFALSLLLILYLFILRNINLLTNVFISLASSALIATCILGTLFEHISIFVLVFGVSISSVAIDYMFHHYIHGYYKEKKAFNKEVFFGFFTSALAFIIISFSSFLLIKQIAIFTVISLFISYVHFSFLYPKIGFKLREIKKYEISTNKIEAKYLLVLSIVLICISLFFINFDTNLQHLDYKNKKLNSLNNFFKEKLHQKNSIPILIETKTHKELIKKYSQIKQIDSSISSNLDLLISSKLYVKKNKLLNNQTFKNIKEELQKKSSKIGFKKDFFKDAYNIKPPINYTWQKLKNLGINYFEYKNKKYVLITLKKELYFKIKNLDFIKPLSMKYLFENSLNTLKNQIAILGLISIISIILIIFFITKKNFLFALNFLLFPLAIILLISYFTALNILHIFMLFIILAISIDYAIYSSKSLNIKTKKAIFFSLLSTFAGFGVLIFSNINSLYSIGIVATLGIMAITFLLLFTKKETNDY